MAAFDGSAYRKEVLAALRDRDPSEVEDLFWLAHVPREEDDDAAVRARLTDARGFLNKELSRARQAAVASAVLKEWPRVEAGLTDAGARRALRARLAATPDAGAAVPPAPPRRRPAAGAAADPAARRRRQVAANLRELARLRGEPELAEDLFALLGLPVTATTAVIEERLQRIGEVNRRRRADRERSLTDDLLAQARELLIVGDPSAYLAGLADDAAGGVVDVLLSGDAPGAVEAVAAARAAGVADTTVLAALAPPARDHEGAIPVSATGLGTWCPGCGIVNAAPAGGACTSCGGALTVTCEACMSVVAADLERCPVCTARLDDARAPLLAPRAERAAELAALAEVDAAPESERPARLAALAAAHPGWTAVARRAAAAPPPPVAWVRVTRAGDDATVTWAPSEEPGVSAYLVERTDPGGTPRVLGRTGLLEWTDRAPAAADPVWGVRALRGHRASAPTAATPAPPSDESSHPVWHSSPLGEEEAPAAVAEPALTLVRATAGTPVVLRWQAPPGASVELLRVERRDDDTIERRIVPDEDGYEDRKVAAGRTYEYRVSLAGSGDPPIVLTVTAGRGGEVLPQPASPPPAPDPQPPPPAPEPTPAAPSVDEGQTGDNDSTLGGEGVLVEGVGATRDPDGRLRVTFTWPVGTTEAWVGWDTGAPPARAGGSGRKVTNMRYELDGGALLDGVPPGAHLAVFAGARDARGTLTYGAAHTTARATAP